MWKTILDDATQAIIIPVILALGGSLVSFINRKKEHAVAAAGAEATKRAIQTASEIVSQSVAHTTQTLVDGLKSIDGFDKEQQGKAFKLTKMRVMTLLSDDAKEAITALFGNLNLWIETKIEQAVLAQKTGGLQ